MLFISPPPAHSENNIIPTYAAAVLLIFILIIIIELCFIITCVRGLILVVYVYVCGCVVFYIIFVI